MKTRLRPLSHDSSPQPIDAARSAEESLLALEAGLREVTSPNVEQASEAKQVNIAHVPSKRPVARIVIASILAMGLLAAGYVVWSCFFRFSAHGVVVAHSAELTAPWAGWITEVHIRSGQSVQQGDLLATVVNPDLDASAEALEDQLRMAQAELNGEEARLRASFLARQDQYLQLRSQYLELQGRLGTETAKSEEFLANRSRLEPLLDSSIVSEQRIESLRSRHEGSRSRAAALQSMISTLEKRLEQAPSQEYDAALLGPIEAKVDQLTAQLERLRLKRERGAIRAPFAGKVVRVHGHVGEPCSFERPIIQLLDTGSFEIQVNVEADRLVQFAVGEQIEALVGRAQSAVTCDIEAVGPKYEEIAPLGTNSTARQKLIPVYLKLPQDLPEGLILRDGEIVHIPTVWGI